MTSCPDSGDDVTNYFCSIEKFLAFALFLASFIVRRWEIVELDRGLFAPSYRINPDPVQNRVKLLFCASDTLDSYGYGYSGISKFTMNNIAPKLQKCWTHKIAFKIISKMLKQPNFFYSQPSTRPKETLAKFYLSMTFGISVMISSVAPTRSLTSYSYLI